MYGGLLNTSKPNSCRRCVDHRAVFGHIPGKADNNFDRDYSLCIQKLYHKSSFAVNGSWNKSLHIQPLQRCYCKNSGSPTSACVMRHNYSITYTQSLHAINGLLAVGRVENLLCGRPSYYAMQTLLFSSYK